MTQLELAMVSLLGPSNHPNWIKIPHPRGMRFPVQPKPLNPPRIPYHRPMCGTYFSNYLAPVDICAYNPCPGVGKWLLKRVLSNSDIILPTLERLTCIYGSPRHYPFSLTRQFPSKWCWEVITRTIITSLHFKKPCIESRATKFKKQSREKQKSFHLVLEYFR